MYQGLCVSTTVQQGDGNLSWTVSCLETFSDPLQPPRTHDIKILAQGYYVNLGLIKSLIVLTTILF